MFERAQRLSASKVLSLANAAEYRTADNECSTPFGIKGTFTRGARVRTRRRARVLNAFRHQRYFHITGALYMLGYPLRVLNAFRHQRYFHARLIPNVKASAWLCSTPFGIKGTFTRRSSARRAVACRCAQRLSASKVLSQTKLRAPRQDRGAQRLSASKVLSLAANKPTFFRIYRTDNHDLTPPVAFTVSGSELTAHDRTGTLWGDCIYSLINSHQGGLIFKCLLMSHHINTYSPVSI